MMNYKETLNYMFSMLPMYQRVGNAAFKKDLTNTLKLLEALGDPHKKLKTVHIAGTNGKGTSAHSMAAILQSAGYKTGLYTSPHLKDFTERIRVNGEPVAPAYVCEFIEKHKKHIEVIQPSFFEITVVMAFDYFVLQEVDIAVIEVGLGGRLDSTNVILPLISLITSISLDHQDMLGETIAEIAAEKAGIIKPYVPVVIGDTNPEIKQVFIQKAQECNSPISFSEDTFRVKQVGVTVEKQIAEIHTFLQPGEWSIELDILGQYYLKNLPGILQTVHILKTLGWTIEDHQIENGLANVKQLTGLKGRWQLISQSPLTIADVGHNIDGIKEVMAQLLKIEYRQLYFVIGGVKEKKWDDIIPLLPKEAHYFIAQPKIPRAIAAQDLAQIFDTYQLRNEIIPDVNDALDKCRNLAQKDDLIFIGGSTFVVAEINGL